MTYALCFAAALFRYAIRYVISIADADIYCYITPFHYFRFHFIDYCSLHFRH